MLALLLGVSVGMESNYRRTLNSDLEPGFGETHARPHPLDETADRSGHKDLPPLCLDEDCPGVGGDIAYLGPPGNDLPGDEVDDATSAIGKPHGPETSPPSFTPGHVNDPVPNWLFVPQGGGGRPDIGNPVPGGPDIDNPLQNPGDTPPSDFTQPPFSNPEGPDGPGPNGPDPGPNGPGPNGPGPDGPPNGGPQPDPPQQIPEPLTLSLFAAGLAGSILLRRRRDHSSK